MYQKTQLNGCQMNLNQILRAISLIQIKCKLILF